jgi:hypothetical protein
MLRPDQGRRVAANERPGRPDRTEGWSRRRGLVAAAVAILVVAATLVLSRLDLSNELSVVRSQLTAANQDLAENQREIDQLEDEARARSEAVTACGDLAELSGRLTQAVELLQRALERGDQGMLSRGISLFADTRDRWLDATERCRTATAEGEQG